MKPESTIASFQRNVRHHGAQVAIYDLVVRSVNRFLYWKTLDCMVLCDVDPRLMNLPENFQCVQLDNSQLASFDRAKGNELAGNLVQGTLSEEDECHAVLDGDTIASYDWYSRSPTLIDDDLQLHFNSQYVYIKKEFIAEAYRDQQIHTVGMMRALKAYRGRGFKGIIAYVESTNFDALKFCYRLGYRNCGQIRVLRIEDQYFIQNGEGCRDYGIELKTNLLDAPSQQLT